MRYELYVEHQITDESSGKAESKAAGYCSVVLLHGLNSVLGATDVVSRSARLHANWSQLAVQHKQRWLAVYLNGIDSDIEST